MVKFIQTKNIKCAYILKTEVLYHENHKTLPLTYPIDNELVNIIFATRSKKRPIKMA